MTFGYYIQELVYASAESICDDVFGRVGNFDRAKAEKFLKNDNGWTSDCASLDAEELREWTINIVMDTYGNNYISLTMEMFKRHNVGFYTSDCEIEVEKALYDYEYFYLDNDSDRAEFESLYNVDLDFEFAAIEKMCDAQTENEVRGIINL